MKLLLGPMLYIEDSESSSDWDFSVALYLAGTDPGQPLPLRLSFLEADAQEIPDAVTGPPVVTADFSELKGRSAGVLWRWRVSLKRTAEARRVAYRFEPNSDGAPLSLDDFKHVVVPAVGALPRAAFFSCNGASDAKTWNALTKLARPFGLWEDMLAQHESPGGGFHLLLGGGDQVYADSLWDHTPELVDFRELPLEEKLSKKVPQGFHAQMLGRYVDLYCERWSGASGIASMLARVPGLYTWDDHDIFDGWGSHEALQDSGWFKALYSAAALAFEAFQLGGLRKGPRPDRREPGAMHDLQRRRFSGVECDLDVLALDLRSGRTCATSPGGKITYTVMSEAQWAALDAWRKERSGRAECGTKPGHILVLSSIPLVHLRYGPTMETMAGAMDLRDDMLDQWESVAHRGERARLMVDLFTLSKEACCAVTVVSGDVHVGAHGRMRSRNPEHLPEGVAEASIEQVTSSGIVHPPPSTIELMAMRMMASESVEDLPSFLQTELLPVGADRYLRERNWLSLRVEPARSKNARAKLWLSWETERTPLSMQVVVEPPPLWKG